MALEYGDYGQDGKKGVYWVGQNGNLYIKGNGADVKDLGKYEGERDNGLFGSRGAVASKYYRQINDWNQAQNKSDQIYSDPRQGGAYDPRAAAEAKARADEIAKYREQERVAAEGLGRLDRQRDIWRGNVENNYANQLNDLENSYTQSKGAYEMNKRDSEAQNRAVRSQIMEDANNQTNTLRQMFAAGGAGDSSAAQIVAPWAVGLEASRNAGSAQDAFARDRRNQDLELASATNAYNKNKKD